MSLIEWLDYLGIIAFAASGALKAVRKHMDAFGVVVLAAITAIGGGMLRDVLAGDVLVVLRAEIHALASLAGAVLLWELLMLGVGETTAIAAAAGLTIVIRMLSMARGWRLPRRVPGL